MSRLWPQVTLFSAGTGPCQRLANGAAPPGLTRAWSAQPAPWKRTKHCLPSHHRARVDPTRQKLLALLPWPSPEWTCRSLMRCPHRALLRQHPRCGHNPVLIAERLQRRFHRPGRGEAAMPPSLVHARSFNVLASLQGPSRNVAHATARAMAHCLCIRIGSTRARSDVRSGSCGMIPRITHVDQILRPAPPSATMNKLAMPLWRPFPCLLGLWHAWARGR